jgi:hypothetical protein
MWAKSQREQEIVIARFNELAPQYPGLPRLVVSPERVASEQNLSGSGQVSSAETPNQQQNLSEQETSSDPQSTTQDSEPEMHLDTQRHTHLPRITIESKMPEKKFLLMPEFPVGFREVVQIWRRLRQPVREGPATEMDLEATIHLRSHTGVVSPVVLVPPRRNTARLLLLVDRQGSMAPFHRFVEEVCTAIRQAGRLKHVAQYYFHDVPAAGADELVLEALQPSLFPTLDPVLPRIQPLKKGYVYRDPSLLEPYPLPEVLKTTTTSTAVVLLSDAGAAHRRYEILRLLDTIAFLKALRSHTSRIVWINPMPAKYWTFSTAEQIARHIPMFALDKPGMSRAVNVLRGQPYLVEKPL